MSANVIGSRAMNFVGMVAGDVNGSWVAPSGMQYVETTDPIHFTNLYSTLHIPLIECGCCDGSKVSPPSPLIVRFVHPTGSTLSKAQPQKDCPCLGGRGPRTAISLIWEKAQGTRASFPGPLQGNGSLVARYEWAVQRGRYMALENIAPLSNTPLVGLPAVAT